MSFSDGEIRIAIRFAREAASIFSNGSGGSFFRYHRAGGLELFLGERMQLFTNLSTVRVFDGTDMVDVYSVEALLPHHHLMPLFFQSEYWAEMRQLSEIVVDDCTRTPIMIHLPLRWQSAVYDDSLAVGILLGERQIKLEFGSFTEKPNLDVYETRKKLYDEINELEYAVEKGRAGSRLLLNGKVGELGKFEKRLEALGMAFHARLGSGSRLGVIGNDVFNHHVLPHIASV